MLSSIGYSVGRADALSALALRHGVEVQSMNIEKSISGFSGREARTRAPFSLSCLLPQPSCSSISTVCPT